MNDFLQQKLTDIENNPLSRFVNIHDLQSANGEGSLWFTVNSNTCNPNQKLHGGILYAMSDVCAFIALASLLPENRDAVTHDIQVSVMRAASEGDQLHFKAKVSKLGRRIAFINTQVIKGDSLIAEARVTKSLVDTSTP